MRVVLVSLDALFDGDLAYLGQRPFWRKWMAHASGCTHVRTVYPALTYPAHTTLVTGVDPAEHGIGQNQPHRPSLAPEMRPWYWEASQVKARSLFDAVHDVGGRCASILWPVTGKSSAIRWNFPEVVALPGENQILKMLRYGTPLWILQMELRYGRDRQSTQEPYLSDYATLLLRSVLTEKSPDFAALHLVDLDTARHHNGTFSRESYKALNRLEARVESIWETMQASPELRDAVLCLVSDHGQSDVEKTICLGDGLKKLGIDGLLSVQSNGFGAYLFPKNAEGEAHLQPLGDLLREHAKSLGIAKVYQETELRAMGAAKNVKLGVEAQPGIVFSDGLSQVKREKATHGFGPGHPAENCLFALRGTGIREGVWIPDMPMRDVAPTLAGLMEVALPKATGKDHSQAFLG